MQDGNTLMKFINKYRHDFENLSEDTFNLLSELTNAKELKKIKKKTKTRKEDLTCAKQYRN